MTIKVTGDNIRDIAAKLGLSRPSGIIANYDSYDKKPFLIRSTLTNGDDLATTSAVAAGRHVTKLLLQQQHHTQTMKKANDARLRKSERELKRQKARK